MPPFQPRLPTHSEIINFLETFLPPQVGSFDVPFLYHTPRHPSYNPARSLVSRIVFSITPTAGVYTALNHNATQRPVVCFLHRPWALDRRSVKHGSLILASHQSFDAHLTVGWNVELARRLGANVDFALCIQGYKDNSDRKIGLVAKLATPRLLSSLAEMIRTEFAGAGELFAHFAPSEAAVADAEVGVLAIMNAFHPEEVERVLATAQLAGWIDHLNDGRRVLYLTGAARQYGLDAAAKVNMPTVCVGHRACEEWGMRHLAQETRVRWPELEVVEVLEEEEPPKPRPDRKEQLQTATKTEEGNKKDVGKQIPGGA
ncbi:hypothetical protein H2198_006232 [Neophaeococcomyces mojaviensis]|uniref:Uncharacterized protein n=1 Tax=Neophaeococcomyces mojaviensis TaxID=3383035 RepID=A0ACC3A416_9EURO|nr:hypothetical protein H2198_006232 [Knufia sp. JES_112]